jgi:hypothetical protein
MKIGGSEFFEATGGLTFTQQILPFPRLLTTHYVPPLIPFENQFPQYIIGHQSSALVNPHSSLNPDRSTHNNPSRPTLKY